MQGLEKSKQTEVTMKTLIIHATLKALFLVQIIALIATGAYAVHLTHINASITVTFGEVQPSKQVALADAVDLSLLRPLPIKRGK